MATKTKSKKNVKKTFFEVKVPLTAAKIQLYAASPEDLDGNFVKLDLTRSLRGKGLELKMRVKNDNGNLVGAPVSTTLVSSYIRRMMRRGADYVEDSFGAECRDFDTIVKPFLITRNKVSREVRKSLRENARKFLLGYFKVRTAEEIFSEIMAGKIQKQMSLKLKKIYPLAFCEIRVFEIKKGSGRELSEETVTESKE